MQLPNGILKMVHSFGFRPEASFSEKCAILQQKLSELKRTGYDGIVTNVEYASGYLRSEENWRVLAQTLRICRELGLRVWLYDEEGYPSGAAGTLTLDARPDLEALALAAVHRVLQPGESATICLPHGHLAPMGGFGFFFGGDRVSQQDLQQMPLRIPFADGYTFKNDTGKALLCLAFFTKPAFEGTHCQHNAFAVRRYIDIGHPDAGKVFAENTYRPYLARLEEFFRDGTVEAFFADEPSYMGVYFNLLKKPRGVVHEADPGIPLYAMVNWSCDLVRYFEARYGYCLTEELPWLFMGSFAHAQKVRQDYYMALTELAQRNFFQPLADICAENGTLSSGHILLEERITDHPLFQGSFFPLLKTMQVPGMDMLDSRPERVWKKAFTPLLVSSISRLHRDGTVMDEVSAHFQNKFSIPVSGQQLFTSLVMQHILGATLFTSYYLDGSDAILHETPDGRTVLQAFRDVLRQTTPADMPKIYLHYPIEAVTGNTVSPVDVATMYDSILNEYTLSYPIDRADLRRQRPLTPLVEDTAKQQARAVEAAMESCMFTLMGRQVPFLFADTGSLRANTPEYLVIYGNALTDELLALLPSLQEKGCTIYCVGSADGLPPTVVSAERPEDLPFFSAFGGQQSSVAARWSKAQVLLANCEPLEKALTFSGSICSATELYARHPVAVTKANGSSCFTVPPYGVILVTFEE